MKEPIKPEDIRKGDLIRWESTSSDDAREWRVTELDSVQMTPRGHWFLLDRPTPAVNLPTEPTLGWASGRTEYGVEVSNLFGSWAQPTDLLNRTGHTYADDYGLVHLKAREVTAFTRATAVPTEALDRLREVRGYYDGGCETAASSFRLRLGIRDFLAAIDAVNGDHA
jgi:hypothetical protein